MEINEFINYTENLDQYTVDEMTKLQPMTDQELKDYQSEIEYDSGNLSDWDHIRAIITFKRIIAKQNEELNRLQIVEQAYHALLKAK